MPSSEQEKVLLYFSRQLHRCEGKTPKDKELKCLFFKQVGKVVTTNQSSRRICNLTRVSLLLATMERMNPKQKAQAIRDKECPPVVPPPPEPPECSADLDKVPVCKMVPTPQEENVLEPKPPYCLPEKEPCAPYNRDPSVVKPCVKKECPKVPWKRKK